MSRANFVLPFTMRGGMKMGDMTVKDSMVFDALTDAFSGVHMGMTAENIAEKFGITRQEQDEFSYCSQQKAIAAVDGGRFKDEIVPINVKDGKNEYVFETDEYPNRSTNPEKLAKLRAAFKKDGTVTAGNASGLNDGASYCLVVSEDAVKKYNLTPLVEIVAIGQGGVDPQFMGLGPVPAIKNALEAADLRLSEIGLIELNEAFAAQSLGVVKLLLEQHEITREELLQRTNVNGGAIALGHPVGASGNRIIVSLIHEMKKRNTEYGLASLCIGGGMGTAVIFKNVL
jgi:acetyl-CoA C-acetyltransferase